MNDKQRTFGQFETPADVADLILGFCLRRPTDRVLDPSCGRGAFLQRAAQLQRWLATDASDATRLWGVELDEAAAAQARLALPEATILNQNFFAVKAESQPLFDALIGNPPYTRAEWIGRLADTRELAQQLTIFGDAAAPPAAAPAVLNRRAGLHAHFLLHGTHFLREGGRFGFVVPNSWLDVAYGERLKQFLLDHYKLLCLIESTVERWFEQARVNTCLLILERCSEPEARAANRCRLIQLQWPLPEILRYAADDSRRYSHLEDLTIRFLPGQDHESDEATVRVVAQKEMPAASRWGVALRAPAVYRRKMRQTTLAPLGQWSTVERGYTTGANRFFYLEAERVAERGVEAEFMWPLLKTLRGVDRRHLSAADCTRRLLLIPATADLAGTAAGDYVAWAESQGWHLRRTCAGRTPWYSLPPVKSPDLVLAKGIWNRHFAALIDGELATDQQIYQLYLHPGAPPEAAAALLNSSWFALQVELQGRVNFGEGVLWLAAYELKALRLPDLRYLNGGQIDELAALFAACAAEAVAPAEEELARPARRALDTAVFQLMGFSAAEGQTIIETLQQRLQARQQKARNSLY